MWNISVSIFLMLKNQLNFSHDFMDVNICNNFLIECLFCATCISVTFISLSVYLNSKETLRVHV